MHQLLFTTVDTRTTFYAGKQRIIRIFKKVKNKKIYKGFLVDLKGHSHDKHF
jgi:hypothetical protein